MAIQILGGIHPVLLTIFLSALVSAIMSSADSSLLAASSLLSNNVIKPLMPNLPEAKMLAMLRVITVLILIVSALLALLVKSIYALMINCWASQLVIVFMPVVTALYFPKSSTRSAWLTMLVSTVVWIGYLVYVALTLKGGFTAIMESDAFQFALTNGSVYGFAAGIAAFAISYLVWDRNNPAVEIEIKKEQ